MAHKTADKLKAGDKIRLPVRTESKAYLAWVKIDKIDKTRVYNANLPGKSSIGDYLDIYYTITEGRREGDSEGTIARDYFKYEIPRRPNKFMRILNAILS